MRRKQALNVVYGASGTFKNSVPFGKRLVVSGWILVRYSAEYLSVDYTLTPSGIYGGVKSSYTHIDYIFTSGLVFE